MSCKRVLVTGGAGFIGSHLVDRLLTAGHVVRVMDAVIPQVHPHGRPTYLNPNAEFRAADVRDADAMLSALQNIDVVVHLAAAVGVGQSMYELVHYSSVNVIGTATLLEAIVKARLPIRRLIVASSMSIYGEGRYECPACGIQDPGLRTLEDMQRGDWAVRCFKCRGPMSPRPTPETKAAAPTSVYAVNKRDQEEMVLTVGRSAGISAVALRFFNVYGARQALTNPYTGVGAIFSSAFLSGRSPSIFEDGLQIRDFIHVSDVVSACVLAIENEDARDIVLNIGTGEPTSVLELASLIRNAVPGAAGLEPKILSHFRHGDIRACYADTSRARQILGFQPRVALADGVKELAAWVLSQSASDRSEHALEELHRYRLVV
jgi:dTDP-L-rhamnose 4-epimerase